MLGDGNYLEDLNKLTRDLAIENCFRFLGKVSHKEILSYYSLFDVFVVPRIPEPVCEIVTPLKPLEAMAMGIPIIASDVPALQEIVKDKKTGLLFRAGDVQELSKCCIELGTYPGLRKALSYQAREWVTQNQDWRIITSKYRNIYDFLLSKK